MDVNWGVSNSILLRKQEDIWNFEVEKKRNTQI